MDLEAVLTALVFPIVVALTGWAAATAWSVRERRRVEVRDLIAAAVTEMQLLAADAAEAKRGGNVNLPRSVHEAVRPFVAVAQVRVALGRPWWRPATKGFADTLMTLNEKAMNCAAAWEQSPRNHAHADALIEAAQALNAALWRWRVNPWSFFAGDRSNEFLKAVTARPARR